jgi:phosphatidyl-myo-inositol alpha-mannosyltransferase
VVASDLDAFRRVLVDGKAGQLVPVDDAAALAAGLIEVLENDEARSRFVEAAADVVRQYDWSVVAKQIMRVYETVAGAGAKVQVAGTAGWGHRPAAGEGEGVAAGGGK